MTPFDILLKHEELIKLVLEHAYLPDKSRPDFNAVKGALQSIDGVKRDSSCTACIGSIIKMANVHLKAHKEKLSKAVFHTFPKHEKDEGTIGEGEKTNPKKARKNRKENRGTEQTGTDRV